MSWINGGQGVSSGVYSSFDPRQSHVPPQPTCRFPGCARPCYVESYGRVHDFCGRTHANEFARLYGRYGSSTSSGSGASAQRKKPTSNLPGSSSRQPMRAVHQLPGATGYSSSSNQIRFYNRGEPYYEFTNFYPTNIFIDGKCWPTTEHYFQAQKFVGTPYMEKIRRLPTPRDAFQLSRDPLVSRWRRSDWESVKDDIMLKALRVKFSECVALRDKLRSTGEKELVEHTSNDSYWGDGGDGSGQNKLGKLLMQVRRELKQKCGPYTFPSFSSSYHSSIRDDSSIPHHRQPSPHPLRRSNSFSNLSSSSSSYQPATNNLSKGSPRPSRANSGVLGGLGQTGKNIGNSVKQGASKLASFPPVPSSPGSSRRRNSWSPGKSTASTNYASSTATRVAGTVTKGVTNAAAIKHKTGGSSGSGRSTSSKKVSYV